MKPFLKSVAEYIYSNYLDEIHSLIIIFPNKRARVFFNNYLSEIAEKPVFAPKYYTISEYMQELSGYLVADQLTLLFELYEVYTSVTKSKESFDDFLFYCEMILADFDDIDKYLVDAGRLFSNLSDLKDLTNYTEYLDEAQIKAIKQFWDTFNSSRDSDEKLSFGNLWNVLFKIYQQFNIQLDNKGLSYDGKAYRKSIEALEENIVFNENKVAFVGFNALNKCEQKLFSRMQDLGKGLFFWDFDNFYIRNQEIHEAGFFLRKFIPKYPPPADFNFDSNLKDENKQIQIYNIPSITGQAKSLSHALDILPENWKNNPVRTAITLADESLLLPVLNSLPAETAEINISMGYPIKETQVYSLIKALLDLLKNKRIYQNGTVGFYHADVIQILQHPLINSGQIVAIDKLLKYISKANLVFISNNKFNQLDNLLQYIFSPDIQAGNFVNYLIDILRQLPGIYLDKDSNSQIIEQETVFQVISQLTRISDILSETKVSFTYKSLIRLVGKVLQGTTVPFSGEPLSGLQVMGVLETRTLDFENLVILSMNEGIFPKSGHVPSLIPYNLRKGFDLPTVEHQDAIFGYYFYRLLHRAKNIVLVYSSSVQDMKSGEPSRFIQQLKYETYFKTKEKALSYKIFPLSKPITEAKKNNETLQILKNKFSGENARILSPSAINTYLGCQLRFYFRFVANIPEPDNILEEVEANVFGNILHRSMENLYQSFGSEIVTESKLKSLNGNLDLIEEELIRAFWNEFIAPENENFPGKDKVEISGKNILIKEVILKYIRNIIDFDRHITPFQIVQLEKKISRKIYLDKELFINVGGYIDRIDRVEGKTRVIDYKTGRLKNSFLSIEDLFFAEATKRNDAIFQLFLYVMLLTDENKSLQNEIVPGLYFVRALKGNNYDFRIKTGERKNIQAVESIAPYLSEYKALLNQTLKDIFATQGKFAQCSDEKYCSYCPYKKICGKE
jgi:CRISPR/Cas system-associated exonuclease Cas4 (RecB family)